MSTVVQRNAAVKREARDARDIIKSKRSNEIFFGVVGPVGAGGSRVMASLQRACQTAGYECVPIKASELIRKWASENAFEGPADGEVGLEVVQRMQDLGDAMRKSDSAEVARAVLRQIAQSRAIATGQEYVERTAVMPDDKKRAYLIDSIRHPAEVRLLRRTYAYSFALIGVVCEEAEREKRILGKYFTDPERLKQGNKERVRTFMSRDADDTINTHGQHVICLLYTSPSPRD